MPFSGHLGTRRPIPHSHSGTQVGYKKRTAGEPAFHGLSVGMAYHISVSPHWPEVFTWLHLTKVHTLVRIKRRYGWIQDVSAMHVGMFLDRSVTVRVTWVNKATLSTLHQQLPALALVPGSELAFRIYLLNELGFQQNTGWNDGFSSRGRDVEST